MQDPRGYLVSGAPNFGANLGRFEVGGGQVPSEERRSPHRELILASYWSRYTGSCGSDLLEILTAAHSSTSGGKMSQG